MPQTDLIRDLELLIRSRHGLIVLETSEEERAETLLRHLADRLELRLFVWSHARGLHRSDRERFVDDTVDPLKALDHIEQATMRGIYLFHGIRPHLEHPRVAARLAELARFLRSVKGAAVLVSEGLELGEPLRAMATTVRLPTPRPEEYASLLQHILRDVSLRMPVKVELTSEDRNSLLHALAGLTLLEAEKVLTKAVIEDGLLDAEDIRRIIDAKTRVVARDGVLEYYPVEENVTEIADLHGLRSWLEKRRGILLEPERAKEYGLSFPKGVLLLGVPGCGKSLCAKVVAMEWRLPLLKLDPGTLYNKYIGESEKNFRRAIDTAERMAPVILWIDEIEKAFSSGSGSEDGGVSTRILGTFLSWLQDRSNDVFVFATANDVSRLPPELLRKGRFDEIFFVDLPDAESRRSMFEIHLRRRNQDPTLFDLDPLVSESEEFTGAEIEGVVVSGLYSAFEARARLTGQVLREELAATQPLSRTMAEKITELRRWKEGRTASAH
jgi:AAA+ superfamily predicted ATPase